MKEMNKMNKTILNRTKINYKMNKIMKMKIDMLNILYLTNSFIKIIY